MPIAHLISISFTSLRIKSALENRRNFELLLKNGKSFFSSERMWWDSFLSLS